MGSGDETNPLQRVEELISLVSHATANELLLTVCVLLFTASGPTDAGGQIRFVNAGIPIIATLT